MESCLEVRDHVRPDGGTRRYSADDIERMRRVADLQDDGVNLAGIGKVLDLEVENAALRREIVDSTKREGANMHRSTSNGELVGHFRASGEHLGDVLFGPCAHSAERHQERIA